MKNQVEQVSRKKQKLLEVKQELEEKFREEQNSLEDIEEKVHTVETKVISPQERERLEKLVNDESEKGKIEFELTAVRDKVEYYQHSSEQDRKAFAKINKQKQMQFITIGVILLILSLYGIYSQQWVLVVISVLASVLIGVFLGNNRSHLNESKSIRH